MSFILVFDIPRELTNERKRINRELHRLGAKQLQHSLWSFENLNSLITIANLIRKSGGVARILEEKFLF